jgi:hypothetical protein
MKFKERGCSLMKVQAICWLILGFLIYPPTGEAQREVYPHLQIFLIPSEAQGDTPFIAFWEEHDRLAAGPLPVRLLERAGFNVLLNLSYSKPDDEQPSSARLKITRLPASRPEDREGQVVLDETAELIGGRGVSKMFPNRPFLVIGHKVPSEGVLQAGNIMKETQRKLLACDRDYRQALEAALNSVKRMPADDHGFRLIESTFPPCPAQAP